jgi:signal transduction histidine kinase/PAS domain-containing protein
MSMTTSGARILHVNDDASDRASVTRILQEAGFTVLEARDSAEALHQSSERPDLVVLRWSAARPVDPIELVATVRSILRARPSERAPRLSLDQNTVILQNIADAVTAQDASGRVVYANDAALRIFGYRAASDFPGGDPVALSSAFEVLDESGLPFDPAQLPGQRVLGGEPAARAVVRWRPRNSRDERWTIVQSRPVHDDRGKVTLAINILHDFTERRRAEQRLAILSEVSAALTSSLDYDETVGRVVRLMVPTLGDWSVLHVIEEEKVHWTACHRDAELDARLRAMAGAPVPLARRVVLPETLFTGRSAHLDYGDAALESRLGNKESVELVRSLGTRSAICAPLVVRGVTVGALTVMSAQPQHYGDEELRLLEDVAHRAALAVDNARVYRRAREAAELRRDLVAVVAHDLKNPLNAVSMAAALLARGAAAGAEGDRSRRQAGIIARASERMNRLIHDLLDVSAIDAGRLELEKRPHPVGALVSEALESLMPAAQERQLTLERSLAPEVEALSLSADRDRLLQVFSNLIGNAVKFTEPGGRVTLSAQRVDGAVRFAVADTGPGIADEHLPHVFDRYWRVRGRTREGTGLGLWIVKGLVEAHGGQVSVDTKFGAGSTFSFTIPLAT